MPKWQCHSATVTAKTGERATVPTVNVRSVLMELVANVWSHAVRSTVQSLMFVSVGNVCVRKASIVNHRVQCFHAKMEGSVVTKMAISFASVRQDLMVILR